jgi:hypothetical protein
MFLLIEFKKILVFIHTSAPLLQKHLKSNGYSALRMTPIVRPKTLTVLNFICMA